MNKTMKKQLMNEIDRLHNKFPGFTYEWGFGFLYFVCLGNLIDGEAIKDSTLARFYHKIGEIDIDNNGYLLSGLNGNNANTKRNNLKELLGGDLYEDIMVQSASYWGHFASELYAQYETIFMNPAAQNVFKKEG